MSVNVLVPLTGPKPVEETVDSLINQKYSADEIIILGNNITQLPEDIEFIERSNTDLPYREVFIRKREKGNALNIGISLAKHELICVLDVDCMLDDVLKNIVRHFDDESVMAVGERLAVMKKSRKLIV